VRCSGSRSIPYLTSIRDEGTFYILFPLAQCNLRTFLNRTTALAVHGNVMLWFLSQLKGLADAVLHLHALGDCVVKHQWTPDIEFIPSRPALHRDLKTENILVFAPAGETSLGTFKLFDFGSAQTSDKSQRSLPQEEVRSRARKPMHH
jgi:serine/threonine protein kinase